MVGAIGFEPTTYGTQNRRATKLRHAPTERYVTGLFGQEKGQSYLWQNKPHCTALRRTAPQGNVIIKARMAQLRADIDTHRL